MPIPVIDWHQDILAAVVKGSPPAGETFLIAGYRTVVAAVFPLQKAGDSWHPPDDRFNETALALELYHAWIDRDPHLVLVENLADLESLPEDRVGVILGVEGGYMISHPYHLRSLYRMGVRLLGLTWNVDTLLAASCKAERDYGLTDLGKRVVEEALKLEMLVDLAHASPRTRQDFRESFPDIPPLYSHGGVLPQPRDARNLSFAEMETFREGLVGLGVGDLFLEREGLTLEALASTAVEVFRAFPEAVAFGSDFFGLSPSSMPPELQAHTDLPVLMDALRRKGLTDRELRAFFFDNSLRFLRRFRKALGGAS